jgi:heterodisulfide reductase subunit C
MGKILDKLAQDIRFQEGLTACINCGTCTAICPAAELYDYDPRKIVVLVQSKNEEELEKLLRSEQIWYCGECMSCVTRCPRSNAAGLILMALRALSQDLGYFVESKKGRQQIALRHAIGGNILSYGYCIYVRGLLPENHPEAGTVWEWEYKNVDDVFARLGGNLDGQGTGVLRKIPQQSLDELRRIFEVTGAFERFDNIEKYSAQKAKEMGLEMSEYITKTYKGEI